MSVPKKDIPTDWLITEDQLAEEGACHRTASDKKRSRFFDVTANQIGQAEAEMYLDKLQNRELTAKDVYPTDLVTITTFGLETAANVYTQRANESADRKGADSTYQITSRALGFFTTIKDAIKQLP